jgi:hypothetical protein
MSSFSSEKSRKESLVATLFFVPPFKLKKMSFQTTNFFEKLIYCINEDYWVDKWQSTILGNIWYLSSEFD